MEVAQPVYILAIKLVNCQSWENTTLEFTSGLNALLADNSTGKSVLFKILKTTANPNFYDNDVRTKLIRWDMEFAEATYLFSDMSCGIVRIFENKVMYFYTPNYQTTAFYSTTDRPILELNDKLSLIVDYEDSFVANILDLDQSLFLVNSNAKSNHNLVKLLTEHRILKRIMPLFKEKIKTVEKAISDVSSSIVRLQHKVDSLAYTNVDTLQDNITMGESFVRVLRHGLKVYEKVNTLVELTQDEINYDDLLKVLELAITVEKYTELNSTELVFKNENDVLKLLNFGIQLENNIDILNTLEIYDNIDSSVLNLVDIGARFESIFGSLKIVSDNYDDISDIDEPLQLITIFDTINKLNNKVFYLEQIIREQEKLDDTAQELKNLESKLQEGKLVSCGLYGKVRYLNGECVPVSD